MKKDRKRTITIALPPLLLDDITNTSKKIGVSRSQLIEDLIKLGVKAVETDLSDIVINTYRRLYNDWSI